MAETIQGDQQSSYLAGDCAMGMKTSEQRSLSSLVAYLLTKAASSYQTEHQQASDHTISPEGENERPQHESQGPSDQRRSVR